MTSARWYQVQLSQAISPSFKSIKIFQNKEYYLEGSNALDSANRGICKSPWLHLSKDWEGNHQSKHTILLTPNFQNITYPNSSYITNYTDCFMWCY